MSNPGLLWLCFFSLCDWSRKTLATLSTNQFKTKTNHDLVARVFPRFRQFVCLYFEFSLALRVIFISSDWSFRLLWFLFYDTRSKPSDIVMHFFFILIYIYIYIYLLMCLAYNPSYCIESINFDISEIIDWFYCQLQVRRSAAKCLSAVLGSRPELLSEFYKSVSPALIARFKGTANQWSIRKNIRIGSLIKKYEFLSCRTGREC